MKQCDFIFDRVDKEHEDYWFRVNGDTEKELTQKYMEQSMVGVTAAVYSIQDGQWGIRRQFPFNYDVITPENDTELHELLRAIALKQSTKG